MIIYNPEEPNGALIQGFIFGGFQQDPHYPDGYELESGETSNGLMRYEDDLGKALLETYMFLQEFTEEQAKVILDRPVEPKFKCDFPECDFSSTAKIGLEGHKRKHLKEIAANGGKESIASLIPASRGRRVITLAEKKKMMDNRIDPNIPNGPDADGVDWYGDGLTVESPGNFAQTKPIGKGHFGG